MWAVMGEGDTIKDGQMGEKEALVGINSQVSRGLYILLSFSFLASKYEPIQWRFTDLNFLKTLEIRVRLVRGVQSQFSTRCQVDVPPQHQGSGIFVEF
jgi:hypothetical protein